MGSVNFAVSWLMVYFGWNMLVYPNTNGTRAITEMEAVWINIGITLDQILLRLATIRNKIGGGK